MSQKDKSASHNNKTSPLTCIDDYEFHRSLGKGSMGKVKLGVHVVSGEKVAVKIVRRANFQINGFTSSGKPRTKEQMMKEKVKEEIRELRTIREAHIMMLLRHPHIVQLRNLVAAGPYFYILMDYVNGGQLLHYIVKRQKLTEQHARQFSRQIVSALDYMHRNSIVHRDLKIENILIDKAGRNIKIIDFGLSNLFCPERRLTTYCGSLYFAAPELLRASPYRGPEIDIWSLGVVIYVMVTGSVPFDDKSMPGLHEKIKRGQVAYPAHVSPSCRDLLSRIFVINPTKRIILADVLRHEWMNQGYNKAIKNYLPLRLPIVPPLAPNILQHMTRGFNMGNAEDIRVKMEMIIKSQVYRSAAEHVARIQHTSTVSTPQDLIAKPYDDPQTEPAAYHPLLSLYHLTRERLSHQEMEQESDSPIKPNQSTCVTPVSATTTTHFDGEDDDDDDDEQEDDSHVCPNDFGSGYPQNEVNRHESMVSIQEARSPLSPTLLSMNASHPPPLVYSTSVSSASNASCMPSELLHRGSLEPNSKLPDNSKSKEKPPKSSFTHIFHRSTSSLAAIFAKVMCTR
ncbi:CAMK/CAMKL/KIN1 protein kinase [Mucor circinelloides 1006PhL]|uniref:CAMK/CAMKL/KIN1 protein kinase n=1 Tax=Mucor circinelloides f. circinelloides (strain 1006PhL) TaxID=1220926 RepID=S2KB09_MUCC1|nr:CAMK/CAMKL/KIN1 protein kinase [Mucor circinelloides 1006PhL]